MPTFAYPPWQDERGQNIAEYALILAVIVLTVVAAIGYFWSVLNRTGP
jgi:Flp pilus assembly pilin Flp